jgi:hypothetical protein
MIIRPPHTGFLAWKVTMQYSYISALSNITDKHSSEGSEPRYLSVCGVGDPDPVGSRLYLERLKN